MKIEKISIDKIKPAEYNPRLDLQPGDEKYEHIKNSIESFGYIDPIIWNKTTGNLVGGHQRYKILKQLGYTEIEAVIVEFDEDKEKAANMAVNKASGDWDAKRLEELLKEVKEYDMTQFGFMENQILDIVNDIREDDYESFSGTATGKVKYGDVWILGKHKLICGDSTKEDTYKKLLGTERVDAIVTDPPYNVDYESGTTGMKIQNDNMDDLKFKAFLSDIFKHTTNYSKKGAAVYVFHSSSEVENFRHTCTDNGFKVTQELIWNKSHFVLSRQDYNWKHEPILYGWKEGASHHFYGKMSNDTVLSDYAEDYKNKTKAQLVQILDDIYATAPTTIINEDMTKKNDIHPTMKPIKLIAKLVANSTKKGQTVFDPCAGSGSLVIACEQLDREARVVELDEGYCESIIERWEEFTGLTARKEV